MMSINLKYALVATVLILAVLLVFGTIVYMN
ncbi:YnhF family membrane protein [Gilliamella sp. W8128]|nr:YnhF family membrane protein [Gilliamella sp. W8128]